MDDDPEGAGHRAAPAGEALGSGFDFFRPLPYWRLDWYQQVRGDQAVRHQQVVRSIRIAGSIFP